MREKPLKVLERYLYECATVHHKVVGRETHTPMLLKRSWANQTSMRIELETRKGQSKTTFVQSYLPERKKMSYKNLLGTDSRSFYRARNERVPKQRMVVLLS